MRDIGGVERWGIVLAGGEGARLRSLTTRVAGDERPKQFCRLLGAQTLLEQTRRRAALVIDPDRTVLALTAAHRRFYAPLVAGTPSRCLIAQPDARGTAPAILYSLLRIAANAPVAAVAVFPSDHWVSDDAAFMDHVAATLGAVEVRPDLVILLGITPERAEAEYGWIEAADPVLGGEFLRVRRFWEKPSPALARTLMARGCLWNSFVMAGRVPAFLALIRAALPGLARAFTTLGDTLGTAGETDAARRLYAGLPSLNFSTGVLARQTASLAVREVSEVAWSDWGRPRRVLATLARLGIRPNWMRPAAASSA